MWNGKLKAVTFSFDDNVIQDIRTIEIMNYYGIKGTFNLNSGLMGLEGRADSIGSGRYKRNDPVDIPMIYRGHEVAAHSVTHPTLTPLSDDEVIHQVEDDRIALSEIVGYEVVGLAYPNGPFDDRIVELIKNHTGIRYARTVISTHTFDSQTDLLRFKPTLHHHDGELYDVCRRFFEMECDQPQTLYIWGHAYEMDDVSDGWERFEKLCKFVSGKSDVFYGTNREVLLGY